jgi:ADP-ribosyl-[dinitrogen reductase] hydrolase
MVAERSAGALLGLALGDAVGTTNEFQTDPPPIADLVGGGPFSLQAGEWTDDTSMALCLADSLIACGGFDALDQMRRYVRWYRQGENSVRGACFDIGIATAAALQRFEQDGNPWAGDPSRGAAGNGSLMRLAPVVIRFQAEEEEAVRYAEASSRTTHAAPQAVGACAMFARFLCRALRGEERESILAPLAGEYDADLGALAAGRYREKKRAELSPSGYVVDSLEAALWCFARAEDFRAGCLEAANLGGDADTIAAIYGQIAGAYFGEQGLPAEWLAKLAWREEIRARALALLV